jgi:hypothetical protein
MIADAECLKALEHCLVTPLPAVRFHYKAFLNRVSRVTWALYGAGFRWEWSSNPRRDYYLHVLICTCKSITVCYGKFLPHLKRPKSELTSVHSLNISHNRNSLFIEYAESMNKGRATTPYIFIRSILSKRLIWDYPEPWNQPIFLLIVLQSWNICGTPHMHMPAHGKKNMSSDIQNAYYWLPLSAERIHLRSDCILIAKWF